jgi:DDE domain
MQQRIEADRGRLKARLRPMRGRKQDRSARVIIVGRAFVQNLRRGHEPAIGRRIRRAGLGDLPASQRRLFSMPQTDQMQHGRKDRFG